MERSWTGIGIREGRVRGCVCRLGSILDVGTGFGMTWRQWTPEETGLEIKPYKGCMSV